MSQERNVEIKNYINDLFIKEEEPLKNLKSHSLEENIPDIHVPSNVGKLLYVLAKMRAPKRILEIGTLVGYSTIWLAKALEDDGQLITLEKMPKHARFAKRNLALSNLENKVEIKVGDASKLLQKMIENGEKPFDVIFIDADKENYPLYLDLVLELSKQGTLILSDNLIPKRDLIGSAAPQDEEAKAIYTFNKKIAEHPNLVSILAPTIVGENGGVDALGISLVVD